MTVGSMELPPEGMLLAGIALAGDEARGVATTHGLSLLFTSAGITVQGPQPGTERLLAWSGLESVACNEQIQLPDGAPAVVMQLAAAGQTVRFLLPSSSVSAGQAAYLDQALPQWLARYGAVAGAPEVPAAAPQVPMPAAPQVPMPAEGGLGDVSFSAPVTPAQTRKGRFGRKAAGGAAEAPDALAGPGGFDVSGLGAPGGFSPSGDILTGTPGPSAAPGMGFPQPGDLLPGDAMPPGAPAAPRSNRTRLIVLGVLLVIVVGGGVVLLVSRNSGTTTASTVTTLPTTANASALAAKMNIVQSNLPSGWAPVTTATGPQVSSAYRQGAQQAMPAFASCLGVPATSIAGLFGTGTQSDVTAHDSSPLFGAPGDPGTTIQSLSQVVSSASQATSDSGIFAKSNFTTCFTQFQTAAYGAVTAGATVQIVPVTLPVKPGVHAYGFVSTVSLPGGTTVRLGNAFVIGGRVEAVLQPNTGSASFPVTVFHQAYGAILDKVAANLSS